MDFVYRKFVIIALKEYLNKHGRKEVSFSENFGVNLFGQWKKDRSLDFYTLMKMSGFILNRNIHKGKNKGEGECEKGKGVN